jgi:hypothetical protein
MLRKILLLVLCVILLCSRVNAEEAPVAVLMKGIGSLSCAHWRSTRATRTEGIIWILGFWTGLNYVAAASEQTQPKADEREIVTEVEKSCAQRSSQALGSAVWTAYLNFTKK